MKMKILKKLMCCASYSLIFSNALLGANPLQMLKNSRLEHKWGQQAVRLIRPSLASMAIIPSSSCLWLTYRNQGSGGNNQGSKGWGTNLSGNYRGQQNKDTEDLMVQLRNLTELLIKQTELLAKEGNASKSTPSPNITHQLVKPSISLSKTRVTTEIASKSEKNYVHESEGRLNAVDSQVLVVKDRLQTRPTFQLETRKEKRNQPTSERVVEMREEFIDEIIKCVQVPNKITREDLNSILDLYGALSPHLKKYITMTLEGGIGTSNSLVYNKIIEHAESKGETLDLLRDKYKRLGEAFGENPMLVIYKVSEKILKVKKNRINSIKTRKGNDINQKEFVAAIVEGANPLYPLYAHEVTAMINLYAVLPPQLKKYITMTLQGTIDSTTSPVYNQVIKYLHSINSDIDTYRKIYPKLSSQAVDIIYKLVEIKRNTQI